MSFLLKRTAMAPPSADPSSRLAPLLATARARKTVAGGDGALAQQEPLPTQQAQAGGLPALSGLTICSTGLHGNAVEGLAALVAEGGGRWQRRLDRGCTHLVGLDGAPATAKLAFARAAGIAVVTPWYLTDSLALGHRPAAGPYHPSPAPPRGTIAFPAGLGAGPRRPFLQAAAAVVVVDGFDLEAASSLAAEVAAAGGQFASGAVEAEAAAAGCTHVICRDRQGPVYEAARNRGQPALSRLWWQECVAAGALLPGAERVYYLPPQQTRPVAGLEKAVISLSGLVGDSRRELRELIVLVGGQVKSPALPSDRRPRRPQPRVLNAARARTITAAAGGSSPGRSPGRTRT